METSLGGHCRRFEKGTIEEMCLQESSCAFTTGN